MSTDKPHLIRLDNQEIRVIDRKLVLGRHPGCSYVIALNDQNNGISSRHAAVDVTGDIAWIEDLGSANGTYVRGKRITGRTQLASGERFELDRLAFEFRAAVLKPQPPVRSAETTAAIGIEELALPPPAPLQPPPRPVKAVAPAPKPEPVAAPPPPAPEPAPIPMVVPKTVEVPVLEAKAPPPPAPVLAPVAAPPPPSPVPAPAPIAAPPLPEPAPPPAPAAAAPAPAAPAPKKQAGMWINAAPGDKTALVSREQREEARKLAGENAADESVSVPTLVFSIPEGHRVTLAQRDSATQEWSIGSNSDIEVSIQLEGLSGLHAKILRNGDTWTISDMMSANGTFVNGQKINRSHLESGNQLGFGPALCTFLLPAGPGFKPTPAVPKAAAAVKSKTTGKQVALPLPLLLGGAVLALALLGVVIYLLLHKN